MGLFGKLHNTFRRPEVQEEAADELAFHLEERTRANIARGMSESEANLAARRRLGNLTREFEDIADANVILWIDSLSRDGRIALRTLRRAPLFAVITVLSLALGIGANTVVFTVMKHIVMDSLPVPNADQLVILHSIGLQEGHTRGDGMISSFSYPQYRDLAGATGSVFGGVLARMSASATIARRQTSERANCELVSGNYFSVLGVKPWRGRLLVGSDNQKPGAHPVAVLGYGLWQRTFGGDPGILNQTVRINSHPYVVVGIAPPNFYGVQIDSPPDVFVPMMMKAQITPTWDGLMDRLDHWATLVARLQPGVSQSRAQAVVSAVYPNIRDLDLAVMHSPSESFLREFRKTHVELAPGGKGYADIRSSLEQPLRFLSVMVLIVLLITVVNVANLLIARGAAREREMAVRLSIGAGKAALVRQVLVESTMLASIGGLFGVALAYAATPVLLKLLSSDLNQSSISARPDGVILVVIACATILSGVAFGLLPALQSARTDLAAALKSEGSTGHTGGRLWLRRSLVGAQVAFSMLLLTGAMLFTKSLRNVERINPGFRTDHIITFKVNPTQVGYSQPRLQVFAEDVRSRLRNLHDVSGLALASMPVLEDDSWGGGVTVEGSSMRDLNNTDVLKNQVSPGFFETLNIPLLAGRTFTDHDLHSNVAIVNATFARHFLHSNDPVGRHFQFGLETGTPKFDWTIVGMVADSQHTGLRTPVKPFVYMPYFTGGNLQSLTFYVRTASGEKAVMSHIRTIMQNVDPALPLYDFRTLDVLIASQLFAERGLALLSL
ncbi:MAG: hypothetical protein JWP08_873, partial [Bryobacterales bacterium]|nr:hypothetical protein [Bryobacterales bacterium]